MLLCICYYRTFQLLPLHYDEHWIIILALMKRYFRTLLDCFLLFCSSYSCFNDGPYFPAFIGIVFTSFSLFRESVFCLWFMTFGFLDPCSDIVVLFILLFLVIVTVKKNYKRWQLWLRHCLYLEFALNWQRSSTETLLVIADAAIKKRIFVCRVSQTVCD